MRPRRKVEGNQLLIRFDADGDGDGPTCDSNYVRWVWGPIVGPSVTTMLAHLGFVAVERGNEVVTSCAEIGHHCGISAMLRVQRSLERADQFGLIRIESPQSCVVPLHSPLVPDRLMTRVPDDVRFGAVARVWHAKTVRRTVA